MVKNPDYYKSGFWRRHWGLNPIYGYTFSQLTQIDFHSPNLFSISIKAVKSQEIHFNYHTQYSSFDKHIFYFLQVNREFYIFGNRDCKGEGRKHYIQANC